ncbi:ATP synthase complex subunit H-domain-containing protein [Ephemerocybe angulata]|uniref:ATP synthase complex subunit H-domain-containing protein n=1 Tax=Ephemerocybe angulata TaxID=980116 RepID=A0A8H6HPU2_9AGAR|nr:ATP synthase complex subunit H-domain-containing protein [Tulosesus angulatus]
MSANLLRIAARQASRTRGFASSAVARKGKSTSHPAEPRTNLPHTPDLVQDLYLREIKSYKPSPVAKDAHVGAVKAFALPPAPKAPTLPADLAAELSAYDAAEPVPASTVSASADAPAHESTGADAFLTFLEADVPKPEAHH